MPAAASSSMRRHSVWRLRGVEAGGRFVEEQHGRDDDEAGGEVEAAAHPARVRAGPLVGRVEEVELGEQLVGAGLGVAPTEPGDASDHAHVLASREQLVDGGLLTGDADRAPDRGRDAAATSWPATSATPPSAGASVVRMRMNVDLPAPFGPSSA